LFEEYTKALLATARSKLGPALILQGSEPQAIVDTALRTFLENPREGINNRNSFWRFLVKVISTRCINEYRYWTAGERNFKREEHPQDDGIATSNLEANAPVRAMERPQSGRHRKLDVDLDSLDRESDDFFDDEILNVLLYGVRPDHAAMLIDLVMGLEPELAQIALMKLNGRSNDEVAKSQGVSARTIADSLKEIAERWSEA
jgi:hypothetical protein